MKRSPNTLWTSWRLVALWIIVTGLAVILMPDSAGPAVARHLFQSPVQEPTATPEPPTPTPEPPTPTPEPPTPTPEPAPPTPEPPTPTPELAPPTPEPPTPTPELPVEPSPTAEAAPPPAEPQATAAPAAPPEPTPTGETIHLPDVETGAKPGPPAEPEAEQPPAAPPEAPPEAAGSEAMDRVRLIDGLTVIFSYVWLACGVLLLLAVPIALILFNRWGRRKRQP